MRYILLLCCCSWAIFIFGDVPGNKPRPTVDIRVSGIKSYPGYTFYVKHTDTSRVLNDSASFKVIGGYGEPRIVSLWAVKSETQEQTDTIYFVSRYSAMPTAIVLHINDRHLYYTVDTFLVRDQKMTVFDISREMQYQGNRQKKERLIRNSLIGCSVLAVTALLLVFWYKRKNRMKAI